jgi:hypothetical protein
MGLADDAKQPCWSLGLQIEGEEGSGPIKIQILCFGRPDTDSTPQKFKQEQVAIYQVGSRRKEGPDAI